MKLALFDDYRLGVVTDGKIVDVTSALPQHDTGLGASFWVRMCQDFSELRPRIEEAARQGAAQPLDQGHQVRLRAPVLNPSKVIAAASNYADHVQEMSGPARTGWQLQFDTFLKAPSAIVGPNSTISLPEVGDREIHHEGELALVIGKQGKNIPEDRALDHVFGYTILVDVTVRGDGDRSRRKSYDGFCPIGPWVVTADEVGDPHALHINLRINGEQRQDVNSGEMLTKIPAIIAFASGVMTLFPGDVITTGSPAGVGKIVDGDTMEVEIEKIGRMTINVAGPSSLP